MFSSRVIHWSYVMILKPVLFRFDAETIHEFFVHLGEQAGRVGLLLRMLHGVFNFQDPRLAQRVNGIVFENPIGLAAGFDYEARLTNVLQAIGFGFGTVGTLTNAAYAGNEKPRLGRLIRSRSLMVNKGFKNPGIRFVLQKLYKAAFALPVGVSIGVTNSKDIQTQVAAIADIVESFRAVEIGHVPFAYYELNISCPNLHTTIELHSPEAFDALLRALAQLLLHRPLFIKMPINKTDDEIVALLSVAAAHRFVSGVIFGNLQKDRSDPAIVPEEAARFARGNFSGKPTEKRSNELISLAYKNYGTRFTIIGCGGVFCAADAYEKMKRGASLVQLVTGMIFEGPQLIGEMNRDLAILLQKDGYASIADAIGVSHRIK